MKTTKVAEGRFLVDFYTPEGKRVRKRVPAMSAAEARRTAMGLEARKARDCVTLQALFDRVEREHWKGTKGHRTAALNAGLVADILGADKDVRSIDQDSITQLIAAFREQGNSAATINRKLSALNTALKLGQRWGLVPSLPYVPRYKESEGRLRVLTRDEENLLFVHLFQSPKERDCLVLMLDTGIRLGEALGLRVRDIDAVQRTISLWETKSGRPRVVPVGTFRKDAWGVLVAARLVPGGDLVFPVLDKGRIRRAWNKAKCAMGLQDDAEFTPHCLRHTCGTRLWELTGDIYRVKEWLGHSVISTTERYTHVSPQHLLAVRDSAVRTVNP